MTKVAIAAEATPSQKVLADASAEVSFTVPDGREIVLVKPDILAQTRLMKMLGPELAANTQYLNAVGPLLYIKSIDGQLVATPVSDGEIEFLLKKLGDTAYFYVGVAIGEHWPTPNLEAVKTAVKKLPGTKT